ncbi:ABC-2 family transporter protein [Butyrivibrio hungatei]|uniref:ABC-2 family transporter protein n=1 Tax=Butyrivibrio hungatei TaxID=185008 RepID=A0A1G5GYH2_9FIRM|nr:ABC transporter permease [Butyrivibrio hungatei]SCY56645.1 ABC-2 family transporter protein [Butyrivibrio hungatei]
MKNVRNELYKLWKGKRLGIFLLILVATSIAFGMLVYSIQVKGLLEKEDIDAMIGGNFPVQVLGMIADIVLPVLATLFVTFLFTDEANSGSLKLPLLCGQSRVKLITAKAVVVLIGSLALVAVTFIASNIVAVMFWGSDSVVASLFQNALIYANTYLALAGWSMVVLFVSIFIKNSGSMVGVAVIVLVVGCILSSVSPKIAQYEVMYYFKAFVSLQSLNYVLAMSVCIGTALVFFILSAIKFRILQIQK